MLANIRAADIDSVLLSLYVRTTFITRPKKCVVHEIRKSFNEMEICWLRAAKDVPWRMIPDSQNDDTFNIENGGDLVLPPIDSSAHVAANEWQKFNITGVVKRYMTSPEQNNGFIIRSLAELKEHVFQSSEFQDVSQRPKLTVYFHTAAVKNSITRTNRNISVFSKQNNLVITTAGTVPRYIDITDLSGRSVYHIAGNGTAMNSVPVTILPAGIVIVRITDPKHAFSFVYNNN